MDCPTEENLVRLKLEPMACVHGLEFDISQRILTVFHTGSIAQIAQALDSLNLGATPLETVTIAQNLSQQISRQTTQRNVLWAVLIINASFFAAEITAGLISDSMGLIADSLDMLADAFVYGLSLLVVGATEIRKKQIARWSGYFQLSLATFGLIEVLRRFVSLDKLPNFRIMVIVSLLALVANALCLYLLQRAKSHEVHMQASLIFTSNDIIINLGVVAAGVLVDWLNTGIPDLIIGAVVFVIVVRGGLRILALSQ